MSKPCKPDYIPDDYAGIKVVGSLDELFNTPFGEANAVLWPRTLRGDFNNVARLLYKKREKNDYFRDLENIARDNPDGLGQAAMAVLQDIQTVDGILKGQSRPLDIRVQYNSGWAGDKGVENFHVDTCTRQETGRILCCYTAPVTQWIKNEDAQPVPGTLHGNLYKARPGTPVYSFRPGDMFRIKSVTHGETAADKAAFRDSCFVHRVPEPSARDRSLNQPRMLWVAG